MRASNTDVSLMTSAETTVRGADDIAVSRHDESENGATAVGNGATHHAAGHEGQNGAAAVGSDNGSAVLEAGTEAESDEEDVIITRGDVSDMEGEISSDEGKGDDGKLSAAELAEEVARRRNFAIISHPDAGKTTLVRGIIDVHRGA